MKKLKYSLVLALITLTACSVNKTNQNNQMNVDTLVFANNPEPVKGKLDVYETMARAAKYNVDVAAQNLNRKIYNQNPNLKPQEIIENILSSDVNDQSRLFAASRVLEFATVYAVANLENNSQYMDNYFYTKSAQHLSTAAIKVHQDAWFASRKLKEVARLMRVEKKKSDALKNKMNARGMLNSEELEYKKNLDVALMKLGEFQQIFAMNIAEYEQMTKVLPKEIKLEGRRFYELEDFDKNYNIEIFQEAAVRNRGEFVLIRDKVKNYGVNDVRHNVLKTYPLVESLDVNGFEVEDHIYENALYQKVLSIAQKLMEDVRELRLTKDNGSSRKNKVKLLADDLAAAVLMQIEVSYRLVEQADADFEANEREIAKIRKDIKRAEAKRRPNNVQKAELLSDKIGLIALEQKSSQIKAERAMALRNLYFNAGLSPFNKTLLKGNINDISISLRESFNQNLVEMLSTVKMQMKERPLLEQTGWAKGDNWLEQVVSEGKKYRKPRVSVSSRNKNAKLLQLGAYENKNSAEKDWQKISDKFVELKQYQPKIEEISINNQKWYRLRIYGQSADLLKLCDRLVNNNFECLLQ